MKPSAKFKTVSEYFAAQPKEIREKLNELRAIIRKQAPLAEEVISYNMPAFKYKGMLVYYAGYNKHIGFYPAGSAAIKKFQDELSGFETSKGTIRFLVDKPLPKGLIKKIVKFRVKQNEEKV
jgi:uncharacterized protein YdhG (YjbR/CyaY superfamily)